MKRLIFISLLLPIKLLAQDLDWGYDRYFYDTITFNKIENNIQIDSSSDNIWKIAKPQKTFFNNSYSDTNAILTDSINFYPDSNNSYFDLYLSNQIYNNFNHGAFWISFKHKMDTDTLKDGGYLTYSRDLGESWFNITDDTMYAGYNDVYPNDNNLYLYSEGDLLYNGENGFSGHFDWIKTEFTWHYIPVKGMNFSDTTILRFNFISDSINNNKEGWMIDDILIYHVNLTGSINEINESIFTLFPNPSKNQLNLKFIEKQINAEIDIINNQGRSVYKSQIFNSDIANLEFDLQQGIYSLVVNSNNKIYRKMIVIN